MRDQILHTVFLSKVPGRRFSAQHHGPGPSGAGAMLRFSKKTSRKIAPGNMELCRAKFESMLVIFRAMSSISGKRPGPGRGRGVFQRNVMYVSGLREKADEGNRYDTRRHARRIDAI